MLKNAIPVVHVADTVAAEEFYGRLGFRTLSNWRADPNVSNPAYLLIERDAVQLHVTSFKDGTVGAWTSNVYVWVDDVDAIYAELTGRGVVPISAPVDQSWGTREFGIRDTDRNVLTFGMRKGGA